MTNPTRKDPRSLRRGLALAAVPLLLAGPGWAQTIHRVDADLATGAGDGSSWADAFQGSAGLSAALAAASPGHEIWIAEGLYRPSTVANPSARFTVAVNEITIRGGFEGFEASTLERRFDAGVETVLSGDLLGNDDGTIASVQDNSARVLNVVSLGVTLEDLRITAGGNAPAGENLFLRAGSVGLFTRATELRRCRCDHSAGAGARVLASSGPGRIRITDSIFDFNTDDGLVFDSQGVDRYTLLRNRTPDNGGDGLRVSTAYISASIQNHVSARNGGSGVEVQLLSRPFCDLLYAVDVAQCTLADNVGVGLRVLEASAPDCFADVRVRSAIVWDNNAGADQFDVPVFFTVTDSIVGASGGSVPDPRFRDSAGGDYALLSTSPAIDAVTTQAPAPLFDFALDFDGLGQHRVVDVPGVGGGPGGAVMDIGALEFTGSIGRHDGCESVPNSTGQTGRLFARGSEEVAANSFSVRGDQLPPGQFAMLLASRQLGATPTVGGPGTLCLGGAIGRFNQPGQILPITPDGLFQLPVDLTRLPQPSSFVAAAPGETWRFQLWHRDVPGPSQFSGIVTVRFR